MKRFNGIIHFINRYKLLHIGFWIWLFIQTLHLRTELQGGDWKRQLSNAISEILSEISSVYFIMYYLVPRYFDRYRYYAFFGASLLFILANSFVFTMLHKMYLFIFYGRAINYSNITLFTFTNFVDSLPIAAIFVVLSIVSTRYKTDQRNKKLEKERLETELSFLKAQINPHFLFNAMNSIYVLIDLDTKEAKEVLLKFSGLLRYQLYECGDNRVHISKELQFLEDYIGLEKMRSKNLKITYKKPDEIPNFEIAPFIIIPLVENAFKHVSKNRNRENFIAINIIADDKEFQIFIKNSYVEELPGEKNVGGIGLQNLTRRMELLYPGTHSLSVHKNGEQFTAKFSFYANKNDLHHS